MRAMLHVRQHGKRIMHHLADSIAFRQTTVVPNKVALPACLDCTRALESSRSLATQLYSSALRETAKATIETIGTVGTVTTVATVATSITTASITTTITTIIKIAATYTHTVLPRPTAATQTIGNRIPPSLSWLILIVVVNPSPSPVITIMIRSYA